METQSPSVRKISGAAEFSCTGADTGIKRAAASHDRAGTDGMKLGVQVTQQKPLWKDPSVELC